MGERREKRKPREKERERERERARESRVPEPDVSGSGLFCGISDKTIKSFKLFLSF